MVEVKDFRDGELVESTPDYYAQQKEGTMYYLGELVDEYEDGSPPAADACSAAKPGTDLP